MTVGSLGDIIFSVSSEMVETLNNLKYSESANYSEHKLHNTKSMLEFTGSSPAEISFNMTLSYQLGVKVEDELNKLLDYTKNGKILKFMLGKTIFGSYRWVITKYTVNYKHFDKNGDVVTADVSLNLKEYRKFQWNNN